MVAEYFTKEYFYQQIRSKITVDSGEEKQSEKEKWN